MMAGVVTGYLFTILVMCKTLGALVSGCVLVPLVRFTKPRTQITIATVLVSAVLAYPILRTLDFIPTAAVVEMTRMVHVDRANSLNERFEQEGALLGRALQRPWFGWGRWGRGRIHDIESGGDISITDGHWIITVGNFGLIGFILEFGLLVLPVFRALRALKFADSSRDQVFLGALALIVAINAVDLLPNSSISPWTWLLAGALMGRTDMLRNVAQQKRLALASKPA